MNFVFFKDDHISVIIENNKDEINNRVTTINILNLVKDYASLFMKYGYYFISKPEPKIIGTSVSLYANSGWFCIYHKGHQFFASLREDRGTKFSTDIGEVCKIIDQILIDYGLC